VLDVGGAAGAYALPLAAEGYEVHLVDPVALHVEQAGAASAAQPDAPLASAVVGDARALPVDDSSVDVVLLLGPLYHLTDAADRARALQEARRALRPGGLLAAAAITRFASTFDGVAHGFLLEPGFEEIVERDLADGQHRNPGAHPRWFTTAYFHLPDELEREIAAAGFEGTALVAVEGAVGAAAEARALDGLARRPRPARDPPARHSARGGGAEPARREPPPAGGRYSTVTVLARLRGWSTLSPRRRAIR
jgi:SAM-dependent methyltransferase